MTFIINVNKLAGGILSIRFNAAHGALRVFVSDVARSYCEKETGFFMALQFSWYQPFIFAYMYQKVSFYSIFSICALSPTVRPNEVYSCQV